MPVFGLIALVALTPANLHVIASSDVGSTYVAANVHSYRNMRISSDVYAHVAVFS